MAKPKAYIISRNFDSANFRAFKLLGLSDIFDITLICNYTRKKIDCKENIVFLKSKRNPFSIFKKIELPGITRFLNNVFYFPGTGILFVNSVTQYLSRIIQKSRTRIVLITVCPPHEIAFIGYKLKKKYPDLIWYVDLTDLWTADEYYFDKFSNLAKRKTKEIEEKIYEAADTVVLTNEFAEQYCRDKFRLPGNKLKHIYHPYDRDIKKNYIDSGNLISRIRNRERIQMAFVGGLFKEPKVPGLILINGLKEFSSLFKWPVTLNAIGSLVPDEVKESTSSLFTISQFSGLDHKDAYRVASQSDFMLLLLGDVMASRYIMHGKYPHYLAMQKPIMAFAPAESFISESIAKTRAGYVIDIKTNIPDQLYKVLNSVSLYGFPQRDELEISKFSPESYLSSWAELIKDFYNKSEAECILRGDQ